MTYIPLILPRAEREMASLPLDVYQRVRDAIRNLSENPRPPAALKLKGRDGWRLRVGKYRVVYEINDKAKRLVVLQVGHRRDVYR